MLASSLRKDSVLHATPEVCPGLLPQRRHLRQRRRFARQVQHTCAAAAVEAPLSTSEKKARELKGFKGFQRSNPKTDKFEVLKFHHIEFWCLDATTTYKRFSWGLGMPLVAKSDQSTGNSDFASYVLKSNDLTFTITAPYSRQAAPGTHSPIPWYNKQQAIDFAGKHGLAVRSVGVLVEDAEQAHAIAVQNGALSMQAPVTLTDEASGQQQTVAELLLYGDVVLRLVSGSHQGQYLAGYTPVADASKQTCGLQRLDHAVGNVHKLIEALDYVSGFTGFHDFAEFTAEDVGTVDSGLNSAVLASDNEFVLLPINEPTFGTPRKSQIQTFLEQNEGPGLQHLAIMTNDIFSTLRELRKRSSQGGFDFMPPASKKYYENLPAKIGDVLTPEQYKECKELGILVDKDPEGVLLQIFSKPLSDRPTVFIEIIQRIGCMSSANPENILPGSENADMVQAGGCGGFGKGNFTELFKSIEDYERTLKV